MNNTIRPFNNKYPMLGERVYIDPKSTVIGDIKLGNDVSVWPMAVLRADVNFISIGDTSNIQDGAILHVTHEGPFTNPGGQPLIIGQGVTIGHQVVLHGCRIDDYCLIGINTIVLDAVHIEHHVMVAAGSLVPPGKLLESGFLYMGSPAKKIRALTNKELEQLEYSAAHYARLKGKYLEASNL